MISNYKHKKLIIEWTFLNGLIYWVDESGYIKLEQECGYKDSRSNELEHV